MAGKPTITPALIGKRFGRWTVLKWFPLYIRPNGNGQSRAVALLCRCDCGNEKMVDAASLRAGRSNSCGCLKKDRMVRFRKHGDIGNNAPSAEYISWGSMIQRCENPRQDKFRYYGGRGISVCQSWRDSYEAFLNDVGRRPHPSMSIDRINNDGNYEPGNVRWATHKQQANNKRRKKPKHHDL